MAKTAQFKTAKRCSSCAHAMRSGDPRQVFCILNPPTPVVQNGNVVSCFPALMLWGKCDKHEPGKVQEQNKEN